MKTTIVSDQLLRTVDRACDILFAFRSDHELLRLKELATRSGLDDATALRIVRTLVARGLVERTGSRQYRSRMRLSTRRWLSSSITSS